jgi:hypothetical protein
VLEAQAHENLLAFGQQREPRGEFVGVVDAGERWVLGAGALGELAAA